MNRRQQTVPGGCFLNAVPGQRNLVLLWKMIDSGSDTEKQRYYRVHLYASGKIVSNKVIRQYPNTNREMSKEHRKQLNAMPTNHI